MRVSSQPKFTSLMTSKFKPINKIESNLASQEKKLYLKKKSDNVDKSNF